MMEKKAVVVGASPNPARYSYSAVTQLQKHAFKVIPLGIRSGKIGEIEILDLRTKPALDNIHTISIYMSAKNQAEWKDYLLSLNPKRIIFNPGAENDEFLREALDKKIDAINACNLVMLSIGNF
ncbi:MAG: CoA-binding protein [Bacteroidetes bacterium]|nr:CoA-binding protein [Bacteroidota bacterium]MDA1119839.1 CoA-binding protein [Bacteroidota bacterium]